MTSSASQPFTHLLTFPTTGASVRLVASLLFCVALVAPASGQQGRIIDEIAAIVDDDILLRSDVNGFVFNVMQQQQLQFSEELWFEALDNLISQKVLAAHARRDTTLEVLPEELTAMLDDRVAQMAGQIGGQAKLEELYGKTIAQIKSDLRPDFEDQILAERFQGIQLQKIKITPKEVERWFNAIPQDSLPTVPETVRLAHIVRFPDVTERARQSARAVLNTIRDSILVGGASFEDMARDFSQDPGSASSGGRYSDVRIDVFVPEFAAVATRTGAGEVSEVFETEYGLHILRVNSRRGDVIDLNQILIQFDSDQFDPTEAVDLLAAVRDSIVTGARTFGAMAKEYSEEQSSAVDGGRVTDPRTGDRNLVYDALGPLWKVNIAGLEVGDISEPGETQLLDSRNAYHIVQLLARVPEHRVSLATDYELIRSFALREKQAREMERWITKLREDVFVEVRAKPSGSVAGQAFSQ